MNTVNLDNIRAQKARLGHSIGKGGYRLLLSSAGIFAVVFAVLLYEGISVGYLAGSIALLCYMVATWYARELSILLPNGTDITGQCSGEVLGRLPRKTVLTPQLVWHSLMTHWQPTFMLNHLLLPADGIEQMLSASEADMSTVWDLARDFARSANSPCIEPNHITTALITASAPIKAKLNQLKLADSDIIEVSRWVDRIVENLHRQKPFFGGVGRDWAFGFTPLLGRYGQNISLSIEHGQGHYDSLTESPGVQAIQHAFTQGSSAIALIGETGVGKTSHVYALAQALLQGKTVDQKLVHNQIIGLNSSLIISNARRPGELEQIILMLLQESMQAGHIILFLDEAQLFFSEGPGAFDASQILLPIVQANNLKLILALSPHDYQNLKTRNASFANSLTPVILQEPPEHDIMRVLEDTALSMEYRHNVHITYEAIREAYHLSGRYDQETAYPGKAIRLLEQSLTHPQNKLIVETSVQQAIEQTRGVKVGAAAPAEADTLLHLEEKIHERMINQTHAVKVVASALRRARAGVANPKRPIGSFLFLGPTGVGKTELAKAIAATYFGAETNMVRLDMSEYQQAEDVSRLLSDGHDATNSLIMAVRQQPFTVVLLDEIEKAHPNILNLLLQLLDEGTLTDISGRPTSFKDCIIIATSNAGAQQIREHIERGEKLADFEEQLTDELISSNQFRPELLNRFDEIVLFRPLEKEELAQVVALMLGDINKTLAVQHISVELTPTAITKIVTDGYDARLGARPMRRMLQRAVEDGVAGKILRGEAQSGDHIVMDVGDLSGGKQEE